jgi:SP family general alpha glucoside:H+ symporter-like MFS transporter
MKNSSNSRRGKKTRPCLISDIAPHTEFLEPNSAALESEPPANFCLEPLRPDGTLISPPEAQVGVTQTNDDFFHSLSGAVPALRGLSIDARDATNTEHRMTFLDGCRLYPKAIAWSALLSTTIVLEGYGTILLNSLLGFPVFRRTFGVPTNPNFLSDDREYEISPVWQAGLINAAYTGQILGLMLNGLLTDRFGYHRVMVGSLICLSLFLFLTVFAINIGMLLASQVLCGFPWGSVESVSAHLAAAHCLSNFELGFSKH